MVRMLTVLIMLAVMASSVRANAPCSRPLRLYSVALGENSWEADIAYLDQLANELWARTELRACIILYNPRRYRRHELAVRMKHLPDYIWNSRGFSREQVSFWFGGHRETGTMEIWLLEPGSCPVPATPTVPSSEAILIPGRYVYAVS
jgi:hypothetical protein